MTDDSQNRDVLADDIASSELIQRLWRRHTPGPCVVDVTQAQNHHRRLTAWIMERFALLDSLQTRYGWGEARANDPLVLGPTPHDHIHEHWHNSQIINSSQILRPGIKPNEPTMVRSIITSTEGPSIPSPTFRVSRSGPGPKLQSHTARPPEAESEKASRDIPRSDEVTSGSKPGLPTSTVPEMPALIFKHEETGERVASSTEGITSITKSQQLAGSAGDAKKEAVSVENPREKQTILRVKPATVAPAAREISPLIFKQDMHESSAGEHSKDLTSSSRAGRTSSTPDEVRESLMTEAPSQSTESNLVMRRQSPGSQPRTDQAGSQFRTDQEGRQPGALGYASPQSTASDSLLMRRGSERSQPRVEESNDNLPTGSMPMARRASRPLVAETDNSSEVATPLVWRQLASQAESFLQSLSATEREKFVRAEPGHSGKSGDSEREQTRDKEAASVSNRPAEVNVGRITEQVVRNIARRLTVERERRGGER